MPWTGWLCRCLKSRFDVILARAPRLLLRLWRGLARGGLRMAALVAGVAGGAGIAVAEHRSGCVEGDGRIFAKVCFVDAPGPERYGHEVLGNVPEWDALHVHWGPGSARAGQVSKLSDTRHVYEDILPRIVDLDTDGVPEIVVVQSGFSEGARLVVYRAEDGLKAVATPYIGTRNRWLAPIGAADLDGDGFAELAFIDRPHLAKTLRVWRYKSGALEPVASLRGVSNHRIGEPFITGGIRDCGDGPEMITADAAWRQVMATRLVGDTLQARALGRFSLAGIEAALNCE